MRVHIIRSAGIRPGGTHWTPMSERELLLFVSADGVTQAGAESLQAMWMHFIIAGEWRHREVGGAPVYATYRRAHPGELPSDIEVECVAYPSGLFTFSLHPEHFVQESVWGIQRCVRDAIDTGWRFYPPPAVVGLPHRWAELA